MTDTLVIHRLQTSTGVNWRSTDNISVDCDEVSAIDPAMDISTHQLAEIAFKALGGVANLDEILLTWHGIGKLIRMQLLSNKAVRLTALGTFTLISGELPEISSLLTQNNLIQSLFHDFLSMY